MKRTQIGWTIIGSLTLPLTILLGVGFSRQQFEPVYWPLAITLLVGLLFGWLTVTVSATEVTAVFGIGLVRRRWLLADIRTATSVRNHWWNGWGVRMGTQFNLYNVNGLQAVEITFRDGRLPVRIGTDQPMELAVVITDRLPVSFVS